MKKFIIKAAGYDFLEENLKFLEKNKNTLYILSNYSLIEIARNGLLEKFEVLNDDSVRSIDDLVKKYKNYHRTYLNKNEEISILKKILKNFEKSNSSADKLFENHAFIIEILEIYEKLKENKIEIEKFKKISENDSEIAKIAQILENYENFLNSHSLRNKVEQFLDAAIAIENSDFNFENVIIYGFIEFREEELEIIKSISKKASNIYIQYPFALKSDNLKLNKNKEIFKNLGFEIIEEINLSDQNKNAAWNIFSEKDFVSDEKFNLIIAKSRDYEIRKVFELVNEYSKKFSYSDISIIAPEDYYENIKLQADLQNIPISMMNEIRIKNLPVIKSLLEFLEFLVTDEKKGMLFFIKDKIFNNFEVDFKDLEFEFRKIDYQGIVKEYYNISDELREFLGKFKALKAYLTEDFINNFKEYLKALNLESKFLKSYEIHSDINILKDSLKALKLINSYLEKTEIFSEILNLNSEEELDLFSDYLKNESYYESDNVSGIRVLSGINAIGLHSEVGFFCGLDSDFPKFGYEKYLSDYKLKSIYQKLNIKIEDRYEKFDNEVLKFASNLSSFKNINFSYVYKNAEEKNEFSVLLKNIISHVEDFNVKKYFASNILDFSLPTSSDYYRGISDIFNREGISYALKKEDAKKIEKLSNNYFDEIENDKSSIISSKNLERIKKLPVLYSYSYNMLNSYKICPFQFYMKYILNFLPLQMDFEDEYNLDKGKYYHEVLKRFYFKNRDFYLKKDSEIEKLLCETIKSTEIDFSEENKDLIQKIYFSYLFNLILADKAEILKREELFIPTFFEEQYFAQISNVKLNGRIDRIDMSENKKIILTDYKSKNIPSKKSVGNLENLQLLIYAILVGKERVAAGKYMNIEEGKSVYMFKENEQDVFELMENAEDEILNIDAAIKNGDFQVAPKNKDSCKYCDYKDICRIEEKKF